MKKEDILNILNEEIMIVEDQSGNKITCIESCDFSDIADAILLLCGVVKSVKENTKQTFGEWAKLNEFNKKGFVWYNKVGRVEKFQDLIKMYKEECQL